MSAIAVDGGSGRGIHYWSEDGTAITLKKPWAFDSRGSRLDAWYSVENGDLVQHVDTAGIVGDVFFDPSYAIMGCSNGYYSALSAWQYLDMYGSSTNYGFCPVNTLFLSRNSYFPSWAFETNVANDYGWVPAKEYGDCSPPALPEGPYWDFLLPCQAHDYCYDLRKAGFSGTVEDSACDDAFYWLMEAHCNNRVFAGDCRLTRDAYYTGVSFPWVITHADPAAVYIQSPWSYKCADVFGALQHDGATIDQWTCVIGAQNELFKFWPADNAGYFVIVAQHSGKCVDVNATNGLLSQWTCGSWPQQRFKVNGAFNQDLYTIRSQYFGQSRCWNIAGASLSNGAFLNEYPCTTAPNERWWIF